MDGNDGRREVTAVLIEPPLDGWGLRAPLEALGHRVLGHATDGKAAVEMVERLSPDLVVMDLEVLGPEGLRSAEQIHAAGRRAMVFVASAWDEASLDAAVAAGAMACLVRPVRVVQLGLSLEVALARHAEREALWREHAELATRLTASKLAVRAKGILMRRLGLGEDAAHLLLQRLARRTRRPLAEAAGDVVAADRFYAELERSQRPPAGAEPPRREAPPPAFRRRITGSLAESPPRGAPPPVAAGREVRAT